MVQDRKKDAAYGFTNGVMAMKAKHGIVRKSTARTFDSVRSTSSYIYSNSSGGEETGKTVNSYFYISSDILQNFLFV